jgi:hypothetical protein
MLTYADVWRIQLRDSLMPAAAHAALAPSCPAPTAPSWREEYCEPSAYVSIRQHTSACKSAGGDGEEEQEEEEAEEEARKSEPQWFFARPPGDGHSRHAHRGAGACCGSHAHVLTDADGC